MKPKTKLSPEVIARQRKLVWQFLQNHSTTYCLQLNFNVPGTPDHVCIGVPHAEAVLFADLIFHHLAPNNETPTTITPNP